MRCMLMSPVCMQGIVRVRELESMNRLLRTQLQDSAASYRAALETAERHLHLGAADEHAALL